MPSVNHADLTDPQLHEPKGVASAAADTAYVADGAGSGTWKKKVFTVTASVNWSALVGPTTSTQNVAVSGVAATDVLIAVHGPSGYRPLARSSGLGDGRGNGEPTMIQAYVSALNQITISATYPTSNNGDPFVQPAASGTYTFVIYRP